MSHVAQIVRHESCRTRLSPHIYESRHHICVATVSARRMSETLATHIWRGETLAHVSNYLSLIHMSSYMCVESLASPMSHVTSG